MKSMAWLALACCVAIPAAAGEITFDLATARLVLDSGGGAARLTFADGTQWPPGTEPRMLLETDSVTAAPRALALEGDRLRVSFENGSQAEFRVERQPGFALFRLLRLKSDQPVERFRLFSLGVPADAERLATLGAAQSGERFAAVMVAEPNVEPLQAEAGGARGDRAGCSHEFTQIGTDKKVGLFAARFAATCNDQPGGWSVRGRNLSRPLDLTGLRAIRVWVHGDGQGEALKIQLFDGRGGYRDNYLTIDFEGWRKVTLAEPALETIDYGHVTSLNFYYNSLPPGKTVTCLLDQAEAIVVREGQERAVLLEDFESPHAPLWGSPAAALEVQTTAKHGIGPAAFGVLACSRGEALETIRRFEEAAGLPSPRPGDEWNKVSPWINRSYFFLTRFKESQFDEALAIARRGGFHTILLGQESWCRATGHYEINRDNFPDGLEGLKRTVERFHAAGFRVGLHFLGPSIYPPDAYLTPVPDPRLVKDAWAELAAPVDEEDREFLAKFLTGKFPAEDGGYLGDGTVLQIDEELVRYGTLSYSAPVGFGKCERGYLGTKAAPHAAGAKIAHLARSYGYHMFDMDTSLLDEVATNFARVANACRIDMIYFDGSERLQGDHWYYNARLHKAFYDKLDNKNMLLQASSFSPYSWHMLARSASADGHGDLKGYLDERSPWFDSFQRGGMPLDIGWYYGYDASATPDMYEYVLGATIGYDASMSYQVSVDAAAEHPFSGEILDLIARYEKLRLSGRVDAAMRERLKIDAALGGTLKPEERAQRLDRRREYRLVGPEGEVAFQRVVYGPWQEVTSAEAGAEGWTYAAPVAGKLAVDLHAMGGAWFAPGPAYSSSEAVVLETFDDLAPYTRGPGNAGQVRAIAHGEAGSTFPGVTQHVELIDTGAPGAGRAAVYTAESTLEGEDGWSVIGKTFNTPIDLARHRAIGFWLRGDGRGGLFKLQLGDGKGAMDYYIRNDYTGWRYQQLTRPERDAIDYGQVRTLMFYYNGLPGKRTVSCGIDDVKALATVNARELVDPYVEIDGRRVAWKGRLGEGEYLVFRPGEAARRYAPRQSEPETGATAGPIELAAGEHKVRVSAANGHMMPVRVRLSVEPPERHEIP